MPETVERPKTRTLTKYRVLKLVSPEFLPGPDSAKSPVNERWEVVGRVAAASSDTAIRAHADNAHEKGVYVAVPERSFEPRNVKVEQQTIVKLE